MTVSSPDIVVNITLMAFHNPKPLFTNMQKRKAAQLIEKSIPVINEAYILFNNSMIPDLRQSDQISRSGLQYLNEEFKYNEKTYDKLKPIFDAPGVKGIEKNIEAYTGIPNDYMEDMEMDLSQIPSSHFWWFFVDDDDDEEDIK